MSLKNITEHHVVRPKLWVTCTKKRSSLAGTSYFFLTADTVTKVIYEQWITRYGCPVWLTIIVIKEDNLKAIYLLV